MANTIGWGQAAVNNTIDWGKGKTNNAIGWGSVYSTSPSGETDISGTPAGDADANAFIAAAAITDATQKAAVNTLVTDLKGYGIWTKMKAIYPFCGGTAAQHKFNLRNPLDTDAAFRLVFFGGWTHSSTGAKPNGTNAYANTNLNDNTHLSLNNTHISTYLRTNADGLYCDMGILNGSLELDIFSKFNNVFYPRVFNTNDGTANIVSSLGLFMANRISSTEVRARQNSTLKVITNNSVQKIGYNIAIGAVLNPGNTFHSPRETAFSSIGDGLTDNEAANYYTAVQAFQTTLGRNV